MSLMSKKVTEFAHQRTQKMQELMREGNPNKHLYMTILATKNMKEIQEVKNKIDILLKEVEMKIKEVESIEAQSDARIASQGFRILTSVLGMANSLLKPTSLALQVATVGLYTVGIVASSEVVRVEVNNVCKCREIVKSLQKLDDRLKQLRDKLGSLIAETERVQADFAKFSDDSMAHLM